MVVLDHVFDMDRSDATSLILLYRSAGVSLAERFFLRIDGASQRTRFLHGEPLPLIGLQRQRHFAQRGLPLPPNRSNRSIRAVSHPKAPPPAGIQSPESRD